MIALDSSVLIAAFLGWHEEHDRAARALARALESKPLLPLHALIETYAVLTRLPAPHRLSPADALALLEQNLAAVRLAGFNARSAWPLLRELAGHSIGGAASSDALILDSARDAGATSLLTLNPRDYERFDSAIEIVAP